MTERSSPTDDHVFPRFAAHGEPQDVAPVFDPLASRLLLLANQLVGDRAAAEDLVQQAFVEAIAGAHRVEAGRPVAPWLTMFLTRRAANENRRQSRQRTEIDVTFARRIDRHLTSLLGYSQLFAGRYFEATGASEANDMVYGQLEYTL